MCTQCGDVGRALDEESRFKSARKLKYMDYEGEVLYWAGAGPKGAFFRNKTKIDQYCTEHAITAPRWVWGCEPTDSVLQAQTVLGLLGNLEDLRAMMDVDAEGALQAALDAWVVAQGFKGFKADFATAVVLDRALYGQTEKVFYEIEGYEPIRDGLVAVDVEDALHLEM